jgi:hypothetical protein
MTKMAKKQRVPSYLSPQALIKSRLLKKAEYEQYKKDRQKIQAMNLRERGKELTSEEKYRRQTTAYAGSRSGKLGGFLSGAFRTASTRGGVTQSLYRRQGQLPPQNIQNRFKTVQGVRSGRKGRPQGTIDKRYAAYGGVYGYRKAMALERFKQKQAILQSRAVSPQQQMILNQIRARQQYNQSNPEGQIIPSTNGDVYLDGIMSEIDAASNAVR